MGLPAARVYIRFRQPRLNSKFGTGGRLKNRHFVMRAIPSET